MLLDLYAGLDKNGNSVRALVLYNEHGMIKNAWAFNDIIPEDIMVLSFSAPLVPTTKKYIKQCLKQALKGGKY